MSTVVGHKRQQEQFIRAFKGGHMHHAYLFAGNAGVGKSHFAMELARSILCTESDMFQPCECVSCQQVRGKLHPDLFLLEDKNLKIDNIRELVENSGYSSYSGGWKVYIVMDAHRLQKEAANAFLKTLEEPSQNTLIILVTSQPEKMLATIRSRCVRMEFSRLTDDEVRSILKELHPDEEYSDELIQAAAGSVHHALTLNAGSQNIFVELVEKGDATALWRTVMAADKETFAEGVAGLFQYIRNRYRKSPDELLLAYSEYCIDILRRLEYNVNLDIIRADFSARTTEVLCAKTNSNRSRF